ncbi:hypothetical protein Plec18167_007983 [Paecilomyces lecythidis]|uniref:Enoyl reductase (ER) domain-containing protein n=1 Tax=Paecilomyces lecythidis TaxID=3004212 RepID=A0ABR3WZ70_9EURO
MGEITAVYKDLSTKAYVVEEKDGPFVLKDVVLDEVRADEVLVEIKYSGLCHTDIVVQHGGMPVGAYPAVLGHEAVGVVRQVGSGVKDSSLKPGDAVILCYRSCLNCSACADGRCGACPHMTELNFVRSRLEGGKSPISYPDGTPVHGQFFGQSSLSKLAIVSERSVVKCDANVEDLAPLTALSCGYLTGAGTVINVLRPKPSSTLAILGIGAVGLSAMLAAKALGVTQIVAVDMVEDKLELATNLGASHTINTRESPDLPAAVHKIFPGGIDLILDTTGAGVLLQASLDALGHDGTLALVGVPRIGFKIQVDALDLLTSCKRIIGVIEGHADPKKIIPYLVQLHRDGKFPVEKISKVYPATKLDEALDDLKSGKVVKPLLSWDIV